MITAEQARSAWDYVPESGRLVWKYQDERRPQWNARYAGRKAGWVVKGYRRIGFRGKMYDASKIVWVFHTGEWPTEILDHINRITTDDRIENLRKATKSENAINTRPYKNNTSGLRGIRFRKGRFEVSISKDRKYHYGGVHPNERDAKIAYNKLSYELHGEFGYQHPIP